MIFFYVDMLFQKGKTVKKHCLFILLHFIHICKLLFLQKISLERRILPLISQLQHNLLNSQKIPQLRLFMVLGKRQWKFAQLCSVRTILQPADFENKMINWKRFPVLRNKNAIISSQFLVQNHVLRQINEKKNCLALSNFSCGFDKVMWYSLWPDEKLITKQNQEEIG